MARYTDDSRERVREAIDFVELVGARTELRSAGVRRLVGRCPFHDERTPSFGIDPIEKLYHCFGCGAGGDVFQFVMDTEMLDFGGALELLADRCGVKLEPVAEDPRQAQQRERRTRLLALLDRTADYYQRVFWESSEAEKAREYLEHRGLHEEVLRKFRVGYAPSAWDRILVGSQREGFTVSELRAVGLVTSGRGESGFYDRFRARIIFPLTNNRGAVIGFGARALRENQQPKYLNSPDGELFHKGRWLYGSALARAGCATAGETVVVEGYTDVISLHQAGITNCVAVMGTAFTEQQATELARLAPAAVFCLDADSAGQAAMSRAAQILVKQRHDLRAVTLPAGSDPAQLVAERGSAAMQELIDGAVPFAQFEVEHALAVGETNTPQGRDRVLSQIADVVGPLPAGILRQQLVQLVANRLGLGESLTAEIFQRGSGRFATRGASKQRSDTVSSGTSYRGIVERSGRDSPGGTDGVARRRGGAQSQNQHSGAATAVASTAQAALARRIQLEHSFIALCLALPDKGAEYLARENTDHLFVSPEAKRAVEYLRKNLHSPGTSIAETDPEVAKLIAELVIRASEVEATPDTLALESLQLELGYLEREISNAKIEGGKIHDLVKERRSVQDKIRELLQ